MITPDTTLEILFEFLEKHSFALITDHGNTTFLTFEWESWN